METIFTVSPRGSSPEKRIYSAVAEAVNASRETAGRRRIVIEDGLYEDVFAVLDGRDAGLVLEPASGRPVLCGGVRLQGWMVTPEGYWRVPLPAGTDAGIRMLNINGRLAPRARRPRTGWMEHETEFAVPWLSTAEGGWKVKPTTEELTVLRYRDGSLPPDFDGDNAEITILHKWDETLSAIAAHDPLGRTLRTAIPCSHPPGAFGVRRFALWNTELTEPGSWRTDKHRRVLEYLPLPGERAEDAVAYLPTRNTILLFDGDTSDITVRGLDFRVTGTPMVQGGFGALGLPGAIQGNARLTDCRFEDLRLHSLSGWGIKLDKPCDGITIQGCEVYGTGAGGFRVMQTESAEANSRVEGNRVHDIGVVYPSALGIAVQNCDVTDNTLTRLPYTGICAGGYAKMRICGNRINQAMQIMNDGGGIYVTSSAGGIMRGNTAEGIEQSDDPDTVRHGLYLDEKSTDWLVEGNLTLDCSSPMLNHMSERNTVRYNAFIGRKSDLLVSFIRCGAYHFTENMLQAAGDITIKANDGALAEDSGNLYYSVNGRRYRQTVDHNYQVSPREQF